MPVVPRPHTRSPMQVHPQPYASTLAVQSRTPTGLCQYTCTPAALCQYAHSATPEHPQRPMPVHPQPHARTLLADTPAKSHPNACTPRACTLVVAAPHACRGLQERYNVVPYVSYHIIAHTLLRFGADPNPKLPDVTTDRG
eukprot:7208832-Pyramimonas_sp.AAC.1